MTKKKTPARRASRKPGCVVDVRRQYLTGGRNEYFAVPWKTAPKDWTRDDMLGVAGLVAELLEPHQGRVYVRFIQWTSDEGLEFSVCDQRVNPTSNLYAHVAGITQDTALSLAPMTWLQSFEWAEVPSSKQKRVTLAPPVTGGDESAEFHKHLLAGTFEGGKNRELWHSTQNRDKKRVQRLVAQARRAAREVGETVARGGAR